MNPGHLFNIIGNVLAIHYSYRDHGPEWHYDQDDQMAYVFKFLDCIMIFCIVQKGINFLFVIKKFRTLFQLVNECIREMIPFLIIVALNVYMFSLMNFVVEPVPFAQKDFFEIGGENYRIIFGENVEGTYDFLSIPKWLIYYLFTMIINIVMMNLLIAIISDEFDRVQSALRSTESKEKCKVLLELGNYKKIFGFWLIKKCQSCFGLQENKRNKLKYIHRFVHAGQGGLDDESENLTDEWTGKMKKMTQR